MKKLMTALCLVLVFSMLLSPAAAAESAAAPPAGWDLEIAVPEGKATALKGEEYYVYAAKSGSLPYVTVSVHDCDSPEKLVADFTQYLRQRFPDLKVTADAAEKAVGSRKYLEIAYSYEVRGYEIRDRRIVTAAAGRTYMFASREVPSLDLTLDGMLEEIVAGSTFLAEAAPAPAEEPVPAGEPAPVEEAAEIETVADAYLYCLDNGMPKYWLDFTGTYANNLVLHCYYRSSDPTFYESLLILDILSADLDEDALTINKVTDMHGIDMSSWFKKLVIREDADGLVLEVERDDKTLAGGAEDNLLTGVYPMEPVGVLPRYVYRDGDGMDRYWLDLSGNAIRLHAMLNYDTLGFVEKVFTVDPRTARMAGTGKLRVGSLFDEDGNDVSGWFRSFTLEDAPGGVLAKLVRDESNPSGSPADEISSGEYLFEPNCRLTPLEKGPYSPEVLSRWAQIRYFTENGFFPPEADFELNDDGSCSIHLYEVVDSDGWTHTATSAWYTVDEYGVGFDEIFGDAVSLAS